MASPVDPLRQHDAGGERGADDDPGARPAALLPSLWAGAKLSARRRRCSSRRGNLPVPPNPLHWSAVADRRLRRRSLAFGARLDQARLHLANEVRVLGEWPGELRLQAAFARKLVRELLELVRR